jgi:eukaryotic-like serine/threonine-protein kinase
MNQERWQGIERLYHAALARPIGERVGFLAEACGGDEVLRREVEALLATPATGDGIFAAPALAMAGVGRVLSDPPTLLGQRLGVYELQARIGAGGMGEVYRARDTRLGRDVAIKILPQAFTSDPDRLARFEREARVLAALNHPNIATIHGVEESDGIRGLVMELVEGETLAERIERGTSHKAKVTRHNGGPAGLPIDEALTIARQIAEALEAAHDKGVVHRDLKPANIKVTPAGVVKVLDFGLARVVPAKSEADSQSPTVTIDRTHEGLVMGTAPYMSPEQARGLPVDKRTDIWAFGCVLYEMLTGRAAFVRDTLTDTLAAVIQGEADWSRLPVNTPGDIRRLLARSLEKDPKQRLRDIGDALADLTPEAHEGRPGLAGAGGTRSASAPATVARGRWSVWVVAAGIFVAGVGIASLWMLPWFRSVPPVRPLRVSVNPPPGGEFRLESGSEISPDGRLIVYVAHTGDADRLWLRPLDSLSARELPGTEGATYPFWSPDSRSIGFFAAGKLKRIDVSGGSPIALCDVTGGRGGTWNVNGVILFNGYNDGPILQVSASGGEPVAVTNIDQSRTENSHRWPQFLPDGRRFLFFVRSFDPQVRGVYVGSLDRPNEKTRVLGSQAAWYAPGRDARTGYLLWVRDDRLVAQPFDAATTQLIGDAVPIADGPFVAANGRELFSASTEGTLLYEQAPGRSVQLTWYGRDGRVTGLVGPPNPFTTDPRISPDGSRIAVIRVASPFGGEVWVIEIDRGVAAPFAVRESSGGSAVAWAPDGQAVAYSWGAPPNLFLRGTDGTDRRLTNTPSTQTLWDWSRDGQYLLYTVISNDLAATSRSDLWAMSVTGSGEPLQLTRGRFQEQDGRFSPDGQWITYTSDESGRNEIYVQRFPDGRMKSRVSTSGGSDARWQADGREIFYRSPDGTLMSVTVRASGRAPELTPPVALFNIPAEYDVSGDGQRFLALVSIEKAEASPMVVVTDWQADLQASGAR